MALRLKYTENKLKIYNLRNLRNLREKNPRVPRVPREWKLKEIIRNYSKFLISVLSVKELLNEKLPRVPRVPREWKLKEIIRNYSKFFISVLSVLKRTRNKKFLLISYNFFQSKCLQTKNFPEFPEFPERKTSPRGYLVLKCSLVTVSRTV